jgi:hypothetical protein
VDAGRTTGVDAKVAEDGRTTGVEAKVAEDTGSSQAALDREMEEKYGPQETKQYNMRQQREPDYSHFFTNTHADEPQATQQMSTKKGLKVFGKDGIEAVKKKMLQLHDRKVIEPKHAAELTHVQKQEALVAYLMFLKRKRCWKIKGRRCDDGLKECAYTAREDAASPAVATKSVFLTTIINALEGQDVAMLDVPRAFMQVDMDE